MPPQPPNIIIVEGTALDNVDHFTYLGSNLSTPANTDAEIQYSIKRPCAAYGRLQSSVFTERRIRTSTKILVYKAVLLPTLLYGSETWVTYRRHIKALKQFQQRTLIAILGVCWKDRTTNASILEQACTISIEARLVKTQLCWAGHARHQSSKAERHSYSQYYQNLLQDADQSVAFKAADSLLNVDSSKLPNTNSMYNLCYQFVDFLQIKL